MKKTIAVDFDGVIHSYHKGWSDGSIYGHCIPGAIQALTELSQDFNIVIYSTRCFDRVINGEIQVNQWAEVHDKLVEWGVPFDEITRSAKPLACLFIDDNAYRFSGSWNVDEIRSLIKT